MYESIGDLNESKADVDLVKACLVGNDAAQQLLFDSHKVKMFSLCLRFTKSYQEAQDLLQEGFVKVFIDLNQFRGNGSLAGWIRTVFIRTALEHIRKHSKDLMIVNLSEFEDTLIADFEDIEVDFNDPKSLVFLMQKLPDGFRAVLNLYVLEDKSHKEIGVLLGIAESTSRSQLARAKEFLKKIVKRNLMLI